MSEENRDTQFLGFAKLLLLDLNSASTRTYESYKLTIARRAYDLVAYILKNADPIDLDTSGEYCPMNDEEAARRIAHLPDLTKWPKEQQ